MNNQSDNKDDPLLRLLLEAERTHSSLQEEGQRLGGMAQHVRDHARVTRNLISKVDLPKSERERLTITWQQQNDAARMVTHQLRETLNIYGISVQATALGTSTAVNNMVFAPMFTTEPLPDEVVTDFIALSQRGSAYDDVRNGFIRCGLDKGQGGHRSPLDLIEDSRNSLEQPSSLNTSPTGALVPLRQALDRTITDVTNRCSPQEPASSWQDKVFSIGRRCGKADTPVGFFERLAKDATPMINRLSGAKDKVMQRNHVLLLYNEGLSYIAVLLEGIDETRLRG